MREFEVWFSFDVDCMPDVLQKKFAQCFIAHIVNSHNCFSFAFIALATLFHDVWLECVHSELNFANNIEL